MALADMQAGGSNAYVARLLEQGYSQTQITARLRARFPGQTSVSYGAAYRAGRESADAAFQLSIMSDDERLLASQVPRDGTGGLGWRYYATVGVLDLQTGAVSRRSVTVYSTANLTVGALNGQILATAQASLLPFNSFTNKIYVQFDVVAADIEYTAVERG